MNAPPSQSSPEIESIVRGLIIHAGAVLVCTNKASGYCYLPGGHIEFGECAQDALQRELREECGLEAVIGRLGLTTEQVFEAQSVTHHELNLVFHVEQLDGVDLGSDAPRPKVESLEPHIAFEWIDLAGVLGVDLRPASMAAWIASGGATDPMLGPFLSGDERRNPDN